jgi:hypothetical protein
MSLLVDNRKDRLANRIIEMHSKDYPAEDAYDLAFAFNDRLNIPLQKEVVEELLGFYGMPVKNRLTFGSFSDLLEEYPAGSIESVHPQVLGPLLRRGMLSLLAGSAKAGKSLFSLAMSLHIAAGKNFLPTDGDVFVPERCKVLLVDAELQRVEIAERGHDIMAAYGITGDEVRGQIEYIALNALSWRTDLSEIRSQVVKRAHAMSAGLIVFDCLYALKPRGSEENDNDMMADLVRDAHFIAVETGAAVLMIDHTGKGAKGNLDLMDLAVGAGGKARAITCCMIGLRQHEQEGCLSLQWKARQRGGDGGMVLAFNEGAFTPRIDLDHRAMVGADATKKTKKRTVTVEKFVSEFIKGDAPMSKDQVVDDAIEFGLSKEDAQRKIKVAIDRGLAHYHQMGTRTSTTTVARGPGRPISKLEIAIQYFTDNPAATPEQAQEACGISRRTAYMARPAVAIPSANLSPEPPVETDGVVEPAAECDLCNPPVQS